MNGIVNSLSTMLAGQHARKACAGSLSPHGHARTLEQDRRRTPGRDLDAASGRTAMARQPQPRRSSFRQGAVVSLFSLHRTTIETQIRLPSRTRGGKRTTASRLMRHPAIIGTVARSAGRQRRPIHRRPDLSPVAYLPRKQVRRKAHLSFCKGSQAQEGLAMAMDTTAETPPGGRKRRSGPRGSQDHPETRARS